MGISRSISSGILIQVDIEIPAPKNPWIGIEAAGTGSFRARMMYGNWNEGPGYSPKKKTG